MKMHEGGDTRRWFKIVTGDETWVQYNTPFFKQANNVWKGKHTDPPIIPRSDFRSSKIMYCILFDAPGPVVQVLVPK